VLPPFAEPEYIREPLPVCALSPVRTEASGPVSPQQSPVTFETPPPVLSTVSVQLGAGSVDSKPELKLPLVPCCSGWANSVWIVESEVPAGARSRTSPAEVETVISGLVRARFGQTFGHSLAHVVAPCHTAMA